MGGGEHGGGGGGGWDVRNGVVGGREEEIVGRGGEEWGSEGGRGGDRDWGGADDVCIIDCINQPITEETNLVSARDGGESERIARWGERRWRCGIRSRRRSGGGGGG